MKKFWTSIREQAGVVIQGSLRRYGARLRGPLSVRVMKISVMNIPLQVEVSLIQVDNPIFMTTSVCFGERFTSGCGTACFSRHPVVVMSQLVDQYVDQQKRPRGCFVESYAQFTPDGFNRYIQFREDFRVTLMEIDWTIVPFDFTVPGADRHHARAMPSHAIVVATIENNCVQTLPQLVPVRKYLDEASNIVLFDHMFVTLPGGSPINNQFGHFRMEVVRCSFAAILSLNPAILDAHCRLALSVKHGLIPAIAFLELSPAIEDRASPQMDAPISLL